jgi:hypothetical protein
MPTRARAAYPHTALRMSGALLRRLRVAARLGAANGNRGSGQRAMTAFEDFFERYHWALLSDDAELAARTLPVLCDTRRLALNSLQDIAFRVPRALAGPVRTATEAARIETLGCMRALSAKHKRGGSPEEVAALQVAEARCVAPAASDPEDRHDALW